LTDGEYPRSVKSPDQASVAPFLIQDQNMTDKEVLAAKKADRLLSQFRTSIDPNIPAQMLQTFMTVALNEGKSLTQIAELVSSNISTTSRHLLELGERNRRMQPGYNLVARTTDPMNLRQNAYTLTVKGKLLLANVIKIMED
jgi:DNA-binding MarR family transcriptional regulator